MKITSVTIEGMHNVSKKTYDLEDRTYFLGENGAGKSTILQAIQLAILGYIPGTNKQKEAIFRHSNGPKMEVSVRFDNGYSITRTWISKGKIISSSVTTVPENLDTTGILGNSELPIFNFNEFSNLTANKLKDWFIEFLPKTSSELDWRSLLKESCKDVYIADDTLLETTVKDISELLSSDDSVSFVRNVNDYLKDCLSFQKGVLKESESTIKTLIYYDEEGLTGDEDELTHLIKESSSEISRLEDSKKRSIRAAHTAENNKRIKTAIEALVEPEESEESLILKKSAAEGQLKKLRSSIETLEESIRSYNSTLISLKSEVSGNNQVVEKKGICPYTDTSCDTIQKFIEKLSSRNSELKADIAKVESLLQEAETSLKKLKKSKDDTLESISKLSLAINEMKNYYLRKRDLESSLIEETPETELDDVEFCDSEIIRLNDKISKLKHNIKYNQLIENLTKKKFTCENTIEVLKIWIKLTDANNLQMQLMMKPFEDIESRMNEYLSQMFNSKIECKFNLSDKANSFSFGILRDNKYIPFDLLSSGEKALFTLALLSCIGTDSTAELKCIIIDDIIDHLDDINASYLYKALTDIENLQFIIAGVKNIDTDGWSIINIID